MLNEELRKKINEDEGYETSLFYTDQSYDNSVIGVDVNGKIVYDFNKMIEEFIDENYPPEVIAEEQKEDPNFDEVTGLNTIPSGLHHTVQVGEYRL